MIYLAVGAVLGATERNPVNGSALILFKWIFDVFFGPASAQPTEWAPESCPPTSCRCGCQARPDRLRSRRDPRSPRRGGSSA